MAAVTGSLHKRSEMREPEKLIQSQQVTFTGTVKHISIVLNLMGILARDFDITVTLTPTSVPDATVGVTQDSQQNPRQGERAMDARKEQACLNTDKELWREEDSYYSPRVFATAQNGIGIEVGGHCFVKPVRDWHKLGRVVDELAVFAFLDERFHGDAGVGLRTFLRERFGIDGSASPDAQGSVTEQSQQNLRQVPDALLERLCGMVYATRGEQYDHGYINDLEYAALVRLRHSGHGSIETVLTALTAQPHHKEREEQGMTEQSQQKSRQDGEA